MIIDNIFWIYQLSYVLLNCKNASCRIRTCGPLLRRQLLYPAELRKLEIFANFVTQVTNIEKTEIEQCDFILCTGLFDDQMEDLNFYKSLLEKYSKKKLICTNPDLTVHRGSKVEFCAGKIAEIFKFTLIIIQ